MGRIIKQEACPYCGSDDLDYGALEFGDECVNYPVLCNKCKGHFTESYDFYFSGQSLDELDDAPYIYGGDYYDDGKEEEN